MRIHPALILLLVVATGAAEESPIVLDNGAGLEFVLEKDGSRHGFRKTGDGFLVNFHPESGLLAGGPPVPLLSCPPSLASTPAKPRKPATSSAAFAKVQMCVLVELGIHNPLVAAIGLKEESEWVLAEELLQFLPESCLLIVDRLYGCGRWGTAPVL